MNGLPWFRMYVDFLNDPKLIGLAFEDQRHYIAILALKSDGTLDQDCDPKIKNRIVAQRLWLDFSTITEVQKRLIDAQLISDTWQPLGWEKRQRNSDHDASGAERQRRYRERQKEIKAKENNVLGSEPVTKTDGDDGGNALCNGIVTLPDKIRIDKNRDIHRNGVLLASDEILTLPEQKQLCPKTANQDIWDAYLRIRKSKRGVNSVLAFKNIYSQLFKCHENGISIEQALELTVKREWKGIDYEWISNELKQGKQSVDSDTTAARHRYAD